MSPYSRSSSSKYQLSLSLFLLCLLSFLPLSSHGWVQPPTRFLSRQHHAYVSPLSSSTTINSSPQAAQTVDDDDDDDDDDEYEFMEYDILTEPDFMSSEWLVGTVMDQNPNKIEETWVRLATDKDGKNVAIWGDGAQGTWSLDVANQFLSMSKENIFGKNIWAGVVDDYYFTYGTVRGWSFISPASVRGQWQAKRLGVDPEEAGTPPWFETSDDGDEAKQEDVAPSKLEAKLESVEKVDEMTEAMETAVVAAAAAETPEKN